MTRMRIDDGGEDDTTTTAAVPDQIWVRARTTMADPNLGATHGRERRELGRRWRLQEKCACVEARSDGVVAHGRRNEGAEGGEEEVVHRDTFSPG
jgi:hypothetical protein